MVRKLIVAVACCASAASAQTSPVPAQSDLVLGADIAARMLPDGTYQRMMGAPMSNVMQMMTKQVESMPLAPFLQSAGLSVQDTSKLGEATIRQVMDIVDPAYQRRMELTMPVMMAEMGRIMTRLEPDMRDGLAHAYAAHFDHAQLVDIDRFLNTPSGRAFAAQNMTIGTDPVVMQKMQLFMPRLIEALPGIMQKAQTATAALPKPKTPQTLTAADRARLRQLLGTASQPVGRPGAAAGRRAAVATTPNQAARPIGDMSTYFGVDRYPPAALRAESEGRVVASVGVGADGMPASCTVQTSSGSGVLDTSTCDIAMLNLRFDPATDAEGRPVAGTYRLAVNWKMPHDPVVPNAASSPSAVTAR